MQFDLVRLFRYDHWANRALLGCLEAQPVVPKRPRQLLAHLIAAQRVWLYRIKNIADPINVWPDDSLEDCQQAAEEMNKRWLSYALSLTAEEEQRAVAYQKSQGRRFTNKVADIIQHVLFHGAYHRGQIATHLRQAGLTPPATDYILAVREGKV
jgi:uncharacterized damage-inducible protein DinB